MSHDLEVVQNYEVVVANGQALSEDVNKLEALEEYYARAKNIEALLSIVEEKLKRQRDLVYWWRDNVRRAGNPINPVRGKLTMAQAESAIKRRQQQIDRWKTALATDDAFARTLVDTQTRCVRTCELEKTGTVRGTEGTGEFELYTPSIYVEAARNVLGKIDLDPASNAEAQKTVRAKRYFSEGALDKEWSGRVFMNPPYHRVLLPQFVIKLVTEIRAKRVSAAIMLTNNCTDTEWFGVAHGQCQAICFTTGRIKFLRPGGVGVLPTQGQAFFYFGKDVAKFQNVFAAIGIGMRPLWYHEGEVDGAEV